MKTSLSVLLICLLFWGCEEKKEESDLVQFGKGKIIFSLVFPTQSISEPHEVQNQKTMFPNEVTYIRVVVRDSDQSCWFNYADYFNRVNGKAEIEVDPSIAYTVHIQAYNAHMVLVYRTRLDNISIKAGETTVLGDITLEAVQ